MHSYFYRLLFLGSIFTFGSFPLAEAGTITVDLRTWDFKESYALAGDWEFYWNSLLTPHDLKNDRKYECITLPGYWNRQLNHSVLGFGTYRKQILIDKDAKGLAIYFPVINSAARVWINGELAAETGKVSATRNSYAASLSSTIAEIPSDVNRIEVIVQVSNYSHFNGGIFGIPKIGKRDTLSAQISVSQSIENFFAGSLIAMFIYQMMLYFHYKRGKPYLWLALICLGVALRAMIVHNGSFMLPNLFPSVSWEVWKKIEFGCVYGIIALFPLYVSHLFREHAPRWPVKYFVCIAMLLCFIVLVTPQYVYGRLLEIGHVALLAAFLYAIYSIRVAWKSGNPDARTIMFGVLISFPFMLIEMLKNSILFPLDIEVRYLVELGVLIFLLFQVYLLANHFANSFKKLEFLNQDLEKTVDARSSQLLIANQVKDRLLSLISHDIRSPLNSLRGILHIYNSGAINAEEFKTYAKHIEGDLTKTGLLVDNILYWTAGQLKGIQVKTTTFCLRSLVNENIELLSTVIRNKKITLENLSNGNYTVTFDRDILNLTLRNLLSNAVKFSYEGGRIVIQYEISIDSIYIRIIDEGTGMTQETITSLQSVQSAVSTLGTAHEKGAGLGLNFCREYLHAAGGKLEISSIAGKGSTFSISIPYVNQNAMKCS